MIDQRFVLLRAVFGLLGSGGSAWQTVHGWSSSTWLFPAYIVSMCLVLTSLVTRRSRTGEAVAPAR